MSAARPGVRMEHRPFAAGSPTTRMLSAPRTKTMPTRPSHGELSHAPARFPLLESLEPRCLLAAYLPQDHALPPVEPGAIFPVANVSDDLRYLVVRAGGGPNPPVIIAFEGEPVAEGDYPAFMEREVRAITRAGTILGTFQNRDVFGAFIHPRGAAAPIPLAELVGRVEGDREPNYNAMRAIDITENGHIVLAEVTGADLYQMWVLVPMEPGGAVSPESDGTLVPLWTTTGTGTRADVNGSGIVVGERRTGPGPEQRQAMVWSRDLGARPIAGMASAGAINETGLIAGLALRNGAPTPAVTFGPTVFDLGLPVEYVVGEDDGAWFVGALGEDGTATFTFVERVRPVGSRSHQFRSEAYILPRGPITEVTAAPLRDVLFGISDTRIDQQPVWTASPLAIADGGELVYGASLLTPIDDDIPFRFIEGAPTTTVTDRLGTVVAGIGPFGDLVAMREEAGVWRPVRISDGGLVGDGIELGSFVDRHTGLARIVVLGAQPMITGPKQVRVYPAEQTAAWTGPGWALLGDPADHGLSVFAFADGRPAIAALNAEGHAVLWWEDPTNPTGRIDGSVGVWDFANLSKEHIEEGRGLEPPAFVSGLVGTATAWGGVNVAGIDDQGHVRSLWWAPGVGEYWTVSDLSASAGAPALGGHLSAFVTAWNGVQYTAADAEGDTVAVWWAPGMASWAATDLTEAIPGAPRLDPAATASLVTPWGAQHIFGVDAQTGEIVVYWWAPTMSSWAAATLGVEGGREVSTGGRPLSAYVTPAGEITVAGFRGAGRDAPLLLGWSPTAPAWVLEDLLAAAFPPA